MTPDRFHTLLHTYGADLRRWPEAERAAATRLAEHGSPELRQQLAEAARLDHWLDSHALPEPDPALARRIVAQAAMPSVRARPWRRRPAWWAGAGFAAIGLAGSLAGALAMSVALRAAPGPSEGLPRSTAFSGLPADWSEE